MVIMVIGGVIGAILGGVFGHLARCAGGQCVLTCNPVGGAIFGMILGVMVASSVVSARDARREKDGSASTRQEEKEGD